MKTCGCSFLLIHSVFPLGEISHNAKQDIHLLPVLECIGGQREKEMVKPTTLGHS